MLNPYKRRAPGVPANPTRRRSLCLLGGSLTESSSEILCEILVEWSRDPRSVPIAEHFTRFPDCWNSDISFESFQVAEVATALTIALNDLGANDPQLMVYILTMAAGFTACTSDYSSLVSNLAGNFFENLWTRILLIDNPDDVIEKALLIFANFYGDKNPATLALRSCVPIDALCSLGDKLSTIAPFRDWLFALWTFTSAEHSREDAAEIFRVIRETVDSWNGEPECLQQFSWIVVKMLQAHTLSLEEAVSFHLGDVVANMIVECRDDNAITALIVLAGYLVLYGCPVPRMTFAGMLELAAESWEAPLGLAALWAASTLLNGDSPAVFAESREARMLADRYDEGSTEFKHELVALVWEMIGQAGSSADWFFQSWGLCEKTIDLFASGTVPETLVRRICYRLDWLAANPWLVSWEVFAEHLAPCLELTEGYLASDSFELTDAGEVLGSVCEEIASHDTL